MRAINIDDLCRIVPGQKARNILLTIACNIGSDGSWITNVKELTRLTGMTEWDVRDSLQKLSDSRAILKQTSNKSTHVTICDTGIYWVLERGCSQTNLKQTSNKQDEETYIPSSPQTSLFSFSPEEEVQERNCTTYNKERVKAAPSETPLECDTFQASAEKVYAEYPTKCVVSGRPTGKSRKKDIVTIKRLLKRGDYTEEQLISIIRRYVDECRQHQSYTKNFSTFLNNIPDYEDPEAMDISHAPDPAPKKTRNWQ